MHRRVGRVIGKNGNTIKALQQYSGALIQIDQTVDPTKVTISGTPHSLSLAVSMVRPTTSRVALSIKRTAVQSCCLDACLVRVSPAHTPHVSSWVTYCCLLLGQRPQVTDIVKGTFKGFALLRQLSGQPPYRGTAAPSVPAGRPVYAPGYGLIPPSQVCVHVGTAGAAQPYRPIACPRCYAPLQM